MDADGRIYAPYNELSGFLKYFDMYRSTSGSDGGGTDRSHYCDLYDRQGLKRQTLSSKDADVKETLIFITGFIQPDVFFPNVQLGVSIRKLVPR